VHYEHDFLLLELCCGVLPSVIEIGIQMPHQ